LPEAHEYCGQSVSRQPFVELYPRVIESPAAANTFGIGTTDCDDASVVRCDEFADVSSSFAATIDA
jgi:hypothetical protein